MNIQFYDRKVRIVKHNDIKSIEPSAKKLMFLAWAKLLLSKKEISQEEYNRLIQKIKYKVA